MKPRLQTLQCIVDALATQGEKPAIVALREAKIEQWSYAKLADHIRRLANGLIGAGLKRGETVLLFGDNRPEYVVAALAIADAGGVVAPVDAQLGDDALAHVVRDSGARFAFVTRNVATRLPAALTVIVLDELHRWLVDQDAGRARVEPGEPAALFYTSGTTGNPKGVPLSHTNLVGQLDMVCEMGLVHDDERMLLPLPLHHVYPFVFGMLVPLSRGVPLVMPQSLTGPQILRALHTGGVTMIIGVPRLYSALAAGLEARVAAAGRVRRGLFRSLLGVSLWLRRRLGMRVGKILLRSVHRQIGPAVRVLASGGAALDPDLEWELEALGWQVSVGYGLTETAPLLSLDPPGQAKPGSVGRPIPGVEIRIDPTVQADETRQQLGGPAGRVVGEILARGPTVFAGYRNLPVETQRVFTDGWFRTGDLGYFDEAGYLYILGRASTLIVMPGGENVQPENVEESYQRHPVIREIGVLQHQGKLVAVIMPKLSANVEDAVRAAVQEQSRSLPSYQRVTDYVVVREPLPRTRLGKIRRQALAELFTGQSRAAGKAPGELSASDRVLLENRVAKIVWEWLGQRYAGRSLTLGTSPQFDLGVDSLEWLELTLAISQRTGVELSEAAIARIDTVRDLLQEVANATERSAPVDLFQAPEAVLSETQKRWLTPLNPVQSVAANGLIFFNRLLQRGLFRLRVVGAERLPASGPFVLTPNHVSYLDVFALGAALSCRQVRETYWAGWTEVAFRNAAFRWFSRLGQAVPIEQGRSAVSSLAFGAAVLRRGKNLVWFPEGERSASGRLLPFKAGIGLLVAHCPVPVVPVYIRGTYAALPVGKFWPRLKPVTVVFGEPVMPGGREPLANRLHDRVAELARG